MKSIFLIGYLVLGLNLATSSAATGSAARPGVQAAKHGVQTSPAALKTANAVMPLAFEANQGQADPSVKFLARAKGYSLFLTPSLAVMVLKAPAGDRQADTIRMSLYGGNTAPVIQGQGVLAAKTNYLLGSDPKKWVKNVANYSKVALKRVYPGIDLVYYGKEGQIEYDFIVAPGANPGLIAMNFAGAEQITLNNKGGLVLKSASGQVVFNAPLLYQKTGTVKTSVKGRFVVASNKQVHFEVGAYDKTRELIIDPSISFSTFLGTTVDDKANALATDASGNVYMTGQTVTVADLFPGTAGHFQTANGGGAFDVFVTKIDANNALVWSTYLGGAGDDIGNAIAVDGAGQVYITGSTTGSGVAPFLTAARTLTVGGGTDAFITVLNPTGTALVYSKFLGGAGVEIGKGIAVDATGNAYVTGETTSDNTTFPATAGAFQLNNGAVAHRTAFVAKLSPAGVIDLAITPGTYLTYLGGSVVGSVAKGTGDSGNAIAIDSLGNAYVTGSCKDTFPTFPSGVLPLARAFKLTAGGEANAFVTKLNPTGTSLLYSSYLAGSGIQEGTGITLDASNNVYITGDTDSGDFPDPVTDGITLGFTKVGQTTISGAPDAFVMKMKLDGTGHLDGVYCTFVGGLAIERANAIALDAAGHAYITGRTNSGDFLTVSPVSIQTPTQSTVAGSTAWAFVTELGLDGSTKVFSTFVGGSVDNSGTGISVDSSNNIHMSGWTNSADYPVVLPLPPGFKVGSFDAVYTKWSPPVVACSIAMLRSAPGNVTPAVGPIIGGTTVTISGANLIDITSIKFGLLSASSFTLVSPTQITVLTPAHAAQVVNVTVNGVAGTCSAPSSFTYFLTPGGAGACSGNYIFPSPATGPLATVAYCMATSGNVTIRVYNEIGDLVNTVTDSKPAGAHTSTVDTGRLAPGVYFYILSMKYDNGNSEKFSKKKFVVKH